MLSLIKFIVLPILLYLMLDMICAAIFGGLLGYDYGGWVSAFTEFAAAIPVGALMYRLAPLSHESIKLTLALMYGLGCFLLNLHSPDRNVAFPGEQAVVQLHWLPLILGTVGMALGILLAYATSHATGQPDA